MILQGKMDNSTIAKKDREREITFVPGCVFLARGAVFEKIGMLDEKFFLYFEDLEFSRRARQHFQLFYAPEGTIYHKSGAGTGWVSYTVTYLYYHTRNRLWVFREDSAIYRIYVFFFTFLNALAKTLALLLASRLERQTQRKISALWRGVKDGIVARPKNRTER